MQDKTYKAEVTADGYYEVVEVYRGKRRTLVRVRSTGDHERDLSELRHGVEALI